MANDGQIVFEVTADGSHVRSDMQSITRTIQQETGKWDDAAQESTGKIEKSFSGMLGKISAALAAAKIGAKLLEIGQEAVGLASDLREVQNVVDVTFGTAGAAKIEEWAKAAGTQFGLTETQAKKFTSTLGAMMKSAGMDGDEIVSMSTDLAGLAADMASFYNLDFDTAFQKIRSGISGETEPLKQLGINMSVANLNAYALKQGLEKTFEQMDQGEQTMLRYQYIMSATADAQGDFARTSEGYANGMRSLETNLDSIKTKLGNVLLDVIEPLVAGINALFPDEGNKTHTVLDDFAGIDTNTEAELAKITAVAQDARDLNSILDEIASDNKTAVIGDIATGANKLKSDSVSNWNGILGALTSVNGLQNLFGSDSKADDNITNLANALAGSSVDTTKAEAWATFLGALSENADAVTALTGTSVEETKTWLSGLAEAANTLDPGSAEGWNSLLSSFLGGINLDTPEGKQFRDALAESFLAMGSESEEAAEGLRALGYDTDEIADKQSLWLETCNKLIKTIPGLSDIINSETGEIKGGTKAISDYIDEMENAQKKAVYLKDIQAKQKALETEFADFAGLEIDVKVAQREFERAREALMETYPEVDTYSREKIRTRTTKLDFNKPKGIKLNEAEELFYQRAEAFNAALENYQNKSSEYATRKVAYDEAVDKLNERKAVVEELVGSLDEATEAETGWSDAMKESARTAVSVADEALKALEDHVNSVRNTVLSAINSTIKGFEKIEKAGDDSREKLQQNAQELAAQEQLLTEYGGFSAINAMSDAEWQKLPKEIQDAYNEAVKLRKEQDELNASINEYSPKGMINGLQSQIDFMDEYLANLEKAKQLGLSDELLAQLSDGSKESAEYLAQLAGADEETIKELNGKYDELQKKKESFADTLTNQQLTVDQVYQALLEEAKKAVAGLDLGDEAAKNSGKTIEGVATGIASKVPDVKDAVDSVLAQLSRLSAFGITFPTFGTSPFSTPKDFSWVLPDGSFASGIDYVPNHMLAYLHEGEAVLTAEENKIRHGYGNQQGIDYDAMGGVMRDNIKAGGNVYLDGRVVGNVISDQQGKSYRQLQRSGWQA